MQTARLNNQFPAGNDVILLYIFNAFIAITLVWYHGELAMFEMC